MDASRATSKCKATSHRQGPSTIQSWLTPLLCLCQPPTWLSPFAASGSASVWEEGAVRIVPCPVARVLRGRLAVLACSGDPTWKPTPPSCSSPIVGHAVGLHRQWKRKRLDHCLFNLIFIVPLLFLPLITSIRKVLSVFSSPLQLLV